MAQDRSIKFYTVIVAWKGTRHEPWTFSDFSLLAPSADAAERWARDHVYGQVKEVAFVTEKTIDAFIEDE